MSQKTNVLIFPAGEINSVELHNALSHNVNICVFGASSIDRHGPFVFERYCSGLPNISEASFLKAFNELLDLWEIHYVFPTHDSVALFLAENQPKLHSKVIVADKETALICRNKEKTYDLFRNESFCPKVFSDDIEYPCFIKPKEGQGGVGARVIHSPSDFPRTINPCDYITTEYLPGEELTVDCISDSNGMLVAVLPRTRDRLMAGVCIAGKSLKVSEEIQNIAICINEKLKFLGLWYFQLKKDAIGKYKLLEISTRCAGTMCLSRARGINLPLLSVYAAMGKKLSSFENPYSVQMDRTLISRYFIDYPYDTVYIDYDDTIIEGDKVCLPVIRFLYQCVNQKKIIVMLTRHEEDHEDTVEASLQAHCLSKSLFNQIILVKTDEEKAKYITPQSSIFIDNAYTERKAVHEKVGIPVFDVEGIEVLLDWRE